MPDVIVACMFVKVNKIEINYAKMAKKMDMKKLKNSMWTLLTESPEKPKEVNEIHHEHVLILLHSCSQSLLFSCVFLL